MATHIRLHSSGFGAYGRTRLDSGPGYRVSTAIKHASDASWVRSIDPEKISLLFTDVFFNESTPSWSDLQDLLADAAVNTFEAGEFDPLPQGPLNAITAVAWPYLLLVAGGPDPAERFTGIVRVIFARTDGRPFNRDEIRTIQSFPVKLTLDTNDGPVSTSPIKLKIAKKPSAMEADFSFKLFSKSVDMIYGETSELEETEQTADIVLESPVG